MGVIRGVGILFANQATKFAEKESFCIKLAAKMNQVDGAITLWEQNTGGEDISVEDKNDKVEAKGF